MATVYPRTQDGVRAMADIARKGIKEVWLNPGADDDAVMRPRAPPASSRSWRAAF